MEREASEIELKSPFEEQHPLNVIVGFPERYSRKLASLSIITAEQFLGTVAADRLALRTFLEVSNKELKELEKLAVTQFSEGIAQKYTKQVRKKDKNG